MCTLLGPEGPDNSCVRLFWGGCGGDGFSQAFTDAGGCWWVWGFWPSVENYIVDASILETGLWSCFTKGESPGWVPFGVPLFGVHWSISCPHPLGVGA